MRLTKGDIMGLLGMGKDVDPALPLGLVYELTDSTGYEQHQVTGNLVMDYRGSAFGKVRPITPLGADILRESVYSGGAGEVIDPETLEKLAVSW